MIEIVQGDCGQEMPKMPSSSIDVVVCSPPYNLRKRYNSYKDNKEASVYFEWLDDIFSKIHRVLKDDGSFFLNVGWTYKFPHLANDVCRVAEKHFLLQNQIIWLKSITVEGKNYGHFKPVISDNYLNNFYEFVFHFRKEKILPIDRLAIGVPYSDKFNAERWGDKPDLRCRGNVWFIPYSTTSPKTSIKKNHPASFPSQLPEYCIRLHGRTDSMVVLDPFLGTGATLVACKQLNVQGIGIELDSEYCSISKEILGVSE